MKISFYDTLLPRIPLVEQAFDALTTLFAGEDETVLGAVRVAELLVREAKNPPPAAIALCLLVPGQWKHQDPSGFAAHLGPDIVDSLRRLYAYDYSRDIPATEDERLAVAATTMRRLSCLTDGLRAQGAQFYEGQRKNLKDAEKILLSVVMDMQDTRLAQAAILRHIEASDMLFTLAERARAKFDFDKTGLPDHPAIRAVHAHVKAVMTEHDPDSVSMQWGIRLAKIVADSGAMPGPEVICAALMSRFSCVIDELPEAFTDRMKHLYRQTSDRYTADPREEDADMNLIRDAGHCLTLEVMTDDYKKFAAGPYAYPRTLEIKKGLVKQYALRLAARAGVPQPEKLRERMEKALAGAKAMEAVDKGPSFVPNGF